MLSLSWIFGMILTICAISDYHDIFDRINFNKLTICLLFLIAMFFLWPLIALYAIVTYPAKLKRDKELERDLA